MAFAARAGIRSCSGLGRAVRAAGGTAAGLPAVVLTRPRRPSAVRYQAFNLANGDGFACMSMRPWLGRLRRRRASPAAGPGYVARTAAAGSSCQSELSGDTRSVFVLADDLRLLCKIPPVAIPSAHSLSLSRVRSTTIVGVKRALGTALLVIILISRFCLECSLTAHSARTWTSSTCPGGMCTGRHNRT